MTRMCFAVALLAGCALSHPAAGQTTFNGGNAFSASNWTNGLPSVGNNGTIAVNGTFAGVFDFNQNTTGTVIINHTAGTLTGAWPNFYNGPTNTASGWAHFNWVQNGGHVALDMLSPNLRVSYTLASGTITRSAGTVSAFINPFNSGVFNQSGGTVTDFAYNLNDTSPGLSIMKTHSFTGGTGVNIPSFITSTNNTAIIDGSFTLTFRPDTGIGGITTNEAGFMNFQDTWTGSWTRDNFTAAQ